MQTSDDINDFTYLNPPEVQEPEVQEPEQG